MGKEPHKIFYQGTTTDFIIFIEDSNLVDKFRKGDTTIPIIDVVSIFKVFVNRQKGSEGMLDEASKMELQDEFGKANINDIITKILREGSDKLNTSFSRSEPRSGPPNK